MITPSKPALAAAKRLLQAGYVDSEVAKGLNPVETVAKLIDEAIAEEVKPVTLSGAKSALDQLKERLAHVHRH